MNIKKKERSKYTEEEIIEGCIQENAFFQELLYAKYGSKLLGLCLRYLKNEAEAEDIFQEAFVKIFLNIGKFRRESSLETWMRRIMTNTALKQLKKAINRYEHVDIEEASDLSENQFVSGMERIQEGDLLNLINKLPTGYKTVFNLYAIEGYSHKEIASQLEITESTSKSQLNRARKYLQNLLFTQNKEELEKYQSERE